MFNQPSVDIEEQVRHEARKALADAIERRSQLKAREAQSEAHEAQSEDREAVKAYSVALYNGLKSNISEAFEELNRNLSNYARVLSRSFPSIDGEEAEDAVAATLFAIWKNLAYINPESFLAYSLVTLTNNIRKTKRKSLESFRLEGLESFRLEDVGMQDQDIDAQEVDYCIDVNSPFEEVENSLVRESLVEMIRKLLNNSRRADIIISAVFLNMSIREIAEKLNISVGQVYVEKSRALQQLRKEQSLQDFLKGVVIY